MREERRNGSGQSLEMSYERLSAKALQGAATFGAALPEAPIPAPATASAQDTVCGLSSAPAAMRLAFW
jgi:hypothetical protein